MNSFTGKCVTQEKTREHVIKLMATRLKLETIAEKQNNKRILCSWMNLRRLYGLTDDRPQDFAISKEI